ncbi:MAG: hypothetical protein KUG79_11870 [Pseudomonadales bacterium]|nr:hypothetical protein [Pseudomonadales bacterium]
MDPIIFQYLKEASKLLRRKLLWLLLITGVTSFFILVSGMLYQPKYQTAITIYADTKNVIKPLLEGQATITTPKSERIRIVREIMFSARILEQVIKASFGENNFNSGSNELEETMVLVRSQTQITAPADNYINVAFSHEQPEVSYRLVNKLTNLFIEQSAQNKRAESKNAYTFIDEQVKSYKNQLVDAENKLKAFEAANIDGIESEVTRSIDRLRNTIDEISINIEAEEVRISALTIQISNENRFASSDYNAQVYRTRLIQLESQLNTLLLNYREGHPDVIELKIQIQDAKRTIVQVEEAKQDQTAGADNLTGEQNLNPIYEELSTKLSSATVELETMKHRLTANQNRLKERYQRRIRIAGNQADLSELTRDYGVTKGIYEDLLERKERARISMTLDLSGQGVTYKVLEPAVFPVLPDGIRFLYFVIAGPILGIFLSIMFIASLILFDNRIKFAEQIEELFPGAVLAVLPNNNVENVNWRLATISIATMVLAYASAALTYQYI